ncbi:MAG: CpXC domain-containing protein [Pseudomonadota bacterium]
MSLFTQTTQACPNCGTEATFDAFFSVNADRRPDLRIEILGEEFMTVTCASCGSDFRLEPDLNYLDMARGTWILAKPCFQLPEWGPEEAAAAEAFSTSFGANAPGAARALGDSLDPRLTFGWPGFREKIVIEQAGLDDVVLEELKLAVLRFRQDNPFAPGVELRLISVIEDVLRFAWVETAGGAELETFDLPRESYDAVAGDSAWQELGAQLSTGLFVDMQRLYIEPTEAEAAAEA